MFYQAKEASQTRDREWGGDSSSGRGHCHDYRDSTRDLLYGGE